MSTKRRKTTVSKYNGGRIRHLENGSFMADYCRHGQRRRACYPTMAEARISVDQWKVESVNRGRSAFGLSERDRLDVAEARTWMGAVALSTVFDFWKTHHPTGEQKTVEQVIEEFLSAPGRRGKKSVRRRPATTEGHRKRLKWFRDTFGQHPAHEVTADDVTQWLDVHGWAGINRRHYLSTVRALFGYAVRKKYTRTNPADVEMPEAIAAEPTIMTVADVSKYLHAIELTCPDLLPREAIAFFAGLRPEELTRLDWRNVSGENKLITVSGDVAKIQGHRRHVTMPENLLAWLAPHMQARGRIWPFKSPTTLHRKRMEARTAAGVDVPDNAGRHCFASYHYAAHENAPKTAGELGHSDVKLLKGVYRNITARDGGPITKAMGEAYFQMMPRRDAKVLRFRKTA